MTSHELRRRVLDAVNSGQGCLNALRSGFRHGDKALLLELGNAFPLARFITLACREALQADDDVQDLLRDETGDRVIPPFLVGYESHPRYRWCWENRRLLIRAHLEVTAQLVQGAQADDVDNLQPILASLLQQQQRLIAEMKWPLVTLGLLLDIAGQLRTGAVRAALSQPPPETAGALIVTEGERLGSGRSIDLVLEAVPRPRRMDATGDALRERALRPGIHPDLETAFIPLDAAVVESTWNALHSAQRHLEQSGTDPPFDIRWRMKPRGGEILPSSLSGPSAGGAFGVAALCLLASARSGVA